jgi:membrane associated rhomboid family serine protease
VLAVVLFLIYGSLLLGVLPSNPGISWQAHLCGALGGIIAARFTVAADRRRPGPTGTPAVP